MSCQEQKIKHILIIGIWSLFVIWNLGFGISSVQAVSNTVLDFDGNDYLTVADNAVLDQANRLSWSVWVKPDITPSADAYIFYSANRYYLKLNSSGQIVGAIYYSSAWRTVTSSAIAAGKWAHIEMIYDKDAGGVDELKLYIDGVLSAAGDHSTAIADASAAMSIGCLDSTPTSCFDGKIDDLRLYQYARTISQIQQDYNAGFAAKFGGDPLSCSTDPGSCMTKGLVGYWGMDEGTGQKAYDGSGNGNNGTLGASAASGTDDPKWITGKTAGALQFDGVNDYVTIADSSSLNFSSANDFTISAWINLKTAAGYHGIYATALEWDSGKVLSFYYTNRFELRYNYGGGAGYESLTSSYVIPTTGIWHQAIFIKSGNIGYFYYDGFLIGTDNTNYLSTMNTIGGSKRIGKSGGVSQYLLNGTIDEVRIYNRALSAEEIRYHYNRGAPVAQWKMDEGEGQRIYDSTDNNKDGYLASSTDVSVSDPAWVQGKFGSALSFDGVNDYASTTVITEVSAFSHSLWFKSSDGVYSADEYLFSQGVDDPSAYLESTDNKVKVMADGADKISSVKTVNDNQWHHLEITADAATLKLYLDGILESSASYTGSSATGVIYIGAKNSTPTSPFGGIIDDVRVYNYARTPAQILQDYNAGYGVYFK